MRVTASKVGLLSECGHWARPEAAWATSTSEAAERGTRFHAAIANYVECGDLDRSDLEDLVAVAAKWVDNYGRDLLRAEVAYSWDPATDRAWRIETEGIPDRRDYANAQMMGYLCGTADLVAVSRVTRTGYIADWKTGDGSRSGPQLRALALMLARAEDLDSVTVEALEVSEDGVRSVCREDLDAFALAAVAGELAEALAGIPTAEPVPGEHCAKLYCPARAACPVGLEVEALIPSEALVRHQWGLVVQSPDHAAYLFERAKLVAKVAEDVLDAVKAYVPAEGLTLSDGRVMAVTEGHTRSAFSAARAKSLLEAKGATPEEIESCSPPAPVRGSLKISKPAAKKKRAA